MMKGVPEFRGTFMRDTLPMVIRKHEASIVNLDSDKGEGTHWTLIYNNPNDAKNVYYFDSFGVAPPEEVAKYMRTSHKEIIYNSSQLQNIMSTMCGYFAIIAAKMLSNGSSFYNVIYIFSQVDRNKNDEFLRKFFKI